MAKPPTINSQPTNAIRFKESDVCHSSVWARNEIMDVTNENRSDAELAVKRGTAEWVNDANPAGNTTNP